MPVTLCVTGPMAAGKNLVSSILEKKGFVSIDADVAGHEVLEDSETVAAIANEFGDEIARSGIQITDSEGKIIRRNLGKLLFTDKKLLQRHERIVFPAISRKIGEFMKENHAIRKNVIVNATVLYKIDITKSMDMIIYVDCPAAVRLLRSRRRDHLPIRQIIDRFKMQKNLFSKYKSSNADIKKVWNIGTVEKVEEKIDRLLKKITNGE